MKTNLITIPNVGKKTKESLINIGITCLKIQQVKTQKSFTKKDCLVKGFVEDRCQLYLFRMAIYYAETKDPDIEKLKWWYWKD